MRVCLFTIDLHNDANAHTDPPFQETVVNFFSQFVFVVFPEIQEGGEGSLKRANSGSPGQLFSSYFYSFLLARVFTALGLRWASDPRCLDHSRANIDFTKHLKSRRFSSKSSVLSGGFPLVSFFFFFSLGFL